MINNSIAEMRTYGEGFIIVDQSPTSVDSAAIKNTNTKVIMRLPDIDDCEIAGRAIGLEDEQIAMLSKLETGVAAVFQSNWEDAVLTKIKRRRGLHTRASDNSAHGLGRDVRRKVVGDLVNLICEPGTEVDVSGLRAVINGVPQTAHLEAAISRYFEALSVGGAGVSGYAARRSLIWEVLDCKGLFDVLKPPIPPTERERRSARVEYDRRIDNWTRDVVAALSCYADISSVRAHAVARVLCKWRMKEEMEAGAARRTRSKPAMVRDEKRGES
jgi:hypothetical protein